jgi:predicted Rossmann fold nucleotide-binding protein DprA/Smf involved in DNA uptake
MKIIATVHANGEIEVRSNKSSDVAFLVMIVRKLNRQIKSLELAANRMEDFIRREDLELTEEQNDHAEETLRVWCKTKSQWPAQLKQTSNS